MIARAIEPRRELLPLSRRSTQIAVRAALGFSLGLALEFIGFGDYGELAKMFTLQDPRLYFTFGGAVAVTALGLRFFVSHRPPRIPMHRSVPLGALLFGVGWAFSGACPGIALVQIGDGAFAAIVTLLAMLVGIRTFDRVNARWLRWGVASCGN